jgi:hypothetical protein
MDGWQPIETAPSDGSIVALYHPGWPVIHKGRLDWVDDCCEDGSGAYLWHLEDEDSGVFGDGRLWPNEDLMPTNWIALPGTLLEQPARDEGGSGPAGRR